MNGNGISKSPTKDQTGRNKPGRRSIVSKFLTAVFFICCTILILGCQFLSNVGEKINIEDIMLKVDSVQTDSGQDIGNMFEKENKVNNIVNVMNTDVRADKVPAYVASLILCNKGASSVTGFLDAAIVLRHSIHKNSIHNPGSSGKYSYKMYAIVHENCKHHAPTLEKMGYEILIRDTPIDRSKIKGEVYRKSVERAMCCGSAEFIKLYA